MILFSKCIKKIKFFSFCVLFYSLSLYVYSKDNFSFSVSPIIDYQNGNFNELVYVTDDNGNQNKMSELNWELKSNLGLGTELSLFYNSFEINLNFLFGVFGQTGLLKDSDFLNYISNYSYINPNLKTNFSTGNINVDSNFSSEISVLYHLPFNSHYSFLPYANFKFSYIDFKGSDITGWYGDKENSTNNEDVSWDSEYATFFNNLGNIDYKRKSFWTFIGIKNLFTYSKFNFNFSLGFSPFLFVESEDLHHYVGAANGSYYLDHMYGFFSTITLDTAINYVLNNNLSFTINLHYLYQAEIQGETYFSGNNKQSWTKQNCIPKCSQDIFCLSFYARFSF